MLVCLDHIKKKLLTDSKTKRFSNRITRKTISKLDILPKQNNVTRVIS